MLRISNFKISGFLILGLCEDGIIVQVFDVEFKVVAPRDVAILQLALPEHGWVEVFVVLRVWMLTDKSTNVDVLASPVIEYHVNGDIVVANKAYYHKDFLVHSFCVILVKRTFFL